MVKSLDILDNVGILARVFDIRFDEYYDLPRQTQS